MSCNPTALNQRRGNNYLFKHAIWEKKTINSRGDYFNFLPCWPLVHRILKVTHRRKIVMTQGVMRIYCYVASFPFFCSIRFVRICYLRFVMFTIAPETEKSCSRLSRFSCWDLIRRIAYSSLSDSGEDAKVSRFLNSADPTISEPGTGY